LVVEELYLLGYDTVKVDILDEHITSIFRVEEYAKQETNMKEAANRTCLMLISCLAYSLILKMEAT
jgi:hypothetical protein